MARVFCCQQHNHTHADADDTDAEAPANADAALVEDLGLSPSPRRKLAQGGTGELSGSAVLVANLKKEKKTDDAVPTDMVADAEGEEVEHALLGPSHTEEVPPEVSIDADFENLVCLERVYDYYDPTRKTYSVQTMSEDLIQQRNVGLESLTCMSSGSDSHGTSSSSSSSNCSSPRGGTPKPRSPRESTRAATNIEVNTRWGVVVGKCLHSRVLPVTTMAYKSIGKRRWEHNKALKSSLWRRMTGRASRIVDQARFLAKRIGQEPVDRYDFEWNEGQGLLCYLFSEEYLDTLMLLAKASRKLLSVQPALVEAPAPCKVFGDIHGQLRDLLLLFRAFSFPGDRGSPCFVFNGDFVDRGDHQLEVIGLLLALKVLMPEKVWLVRGNHEDRDMNEKYGFRDQCLRHLGREMGLKTYKLMQETFDQLPVACLIAGRVLVVHGGIGDGRWDLNQARSIQRPLASKDLADPRNKWIYNILWSDPIGDTASDNQGVFGVHESPRTGSAVLFGWNVTKTFCARNGISLIVRSHQSTEGGTGFDVMHENLLIRVFSARDYEGHGNDGAILLISPPADDNPDGPLLVRPQVLRSVTKAREEMHRKAMSALNKRSVLRARSTCSDGGDETEATAARFSTVGAGTSASSGAEGVKSQPPPRGPRRSWRGVAKAEPVRQADHKAEPPDNTSSSPRGAAAAATAPVAAPATSATAASIGAAGGSSTPRGSAHTSPSATPKVPSTSPSPSKVPYGATKLSSGSGTNNEMQPMVASKAPGRKPLGTASVPPLHLEQAGVTR